MGQYRRAYSDLTKREADKLAKDLKKRKYKYTRRKDPNGRFEIWMWSPN